MNERLDEVTGHLLTILTVINYEIYLFLKCSYPLLTEDLRQCLLFSKRFICLYDELYNGVSLRSNARLRVINLTSSLENSVLITRAYSWLQYSLRSKHSADSR